MRSWAGGPITFYQTLTESYEMPTVFRHGPFAFVFFSSDRNEPPHVHVKRDRAIAKYWLEPVSLAKNIDFKKPALKKIAKLVEQNQGLLLEAWHEYFGA